jgi:phosphatidate cytidylyltransferase
MSPEDREREGKFEDLFDDLDRFFEPEEDAPQVSGGPAEAPSSGGTVGAEAHGGTESTPAGGARGAEQPEQEREEEILPPAWREVGDLDLEDETGEHPPIESWQPDQESEPPSVEAAGPGEPTEGGSPSEPQPEWRAEPTAEMTGEDWKRLRDVISDEEGGEEFGLLTEEPPPGETLFGFEGEEEDEQEQPPLTIEDLKKAPPEYRDLPSAEEEAGEPELVGVTLGEMPEPEEAGDFYGSEPAMADVEAAADQLAQEYGEVPSGPESMAATTPTGPETDDDLLADLHPPGPRTIRIDSDSLTGPTWEEPSSRALRVEPVATPFGDRNLPAAVISATILVVAALISLAVGKGAFAIVAGLVILIGQAELYGTMQRRGAQPATALGLVMGALVLGAAYLRGEQAMLFVLPLALMLSFLWFMAAPPKAREGALANIGATMLGLVYVPFLAAYVLLLLSVASGRALVLTVLGLTFLYDVVAFLVGSFYGNHPLAPTISPKKTREGLYGASLLTLVVSVAFVSQVHPLGTVVRALLLGIVVIVFAPLGDLAESAIKRELGVKDMGSIMPGHGGVLDRIDSVLFVVPAAFYLLRLIF